MLRKLFINALFYTTKQLAKLANCSVLQGGTRRKSDVIYIIDGILNFIHERLYSEIWIMIVDILHIDQKRTKSSSEIPRVLFLVF